MKRKAMHLFLVCAGLLALPAVAFGQQPAVTPEAVVFTLESQPATGQLNGSAEARGQLRFTITAANADDTLSGTVEFTLAEETRKQLAQLTGKPLSQVPRVVSTSTAVAEFEKDTGPPVIHLEVRGATVEAAGVNIRFPLLVFDLKARQSEITRYTGAEMEALLTNWARQINSGRSRRGLIMRINRVIKGE